MYNPYVYSTENVWLSFCTKGAIGESVMGFASDFLRKVWVPFKKKNCGGQQL